MWYTIAWLARVILYPVILALLVSAGWELNLIQTWGVYFFGLILVYIAEDTGRLSGRIR